MLKLKNIQQLPIFSLFLFVCLFLISWMGISFGKSVFLCFLTENYQKTLMEE